MTPKSTFDPDLPSVYWQLAVEAPAAAANLNTGRIAIALTPTSTDYYAKAAWTDRAPLMVQTRIVDSFENTPQDRRGGPRIDRHPRQLRAAARPAQLRGALLLRQAADRARAHHRQAGAHARPADHRRRLLRALRARARRHDSQGRRRLRPGAGQRHQAAGRLDAAHAAGAPAERRRALQHRALSQPGQRRGRQRELPQGQRRLDGAGHGRVRWGAPLHARSCLRSARVRARLISIERHGARAPDNERTWRSAPPA